MARYVNGQRGQMYPQTWRKELITFQDFSGGMNSETSNENLLDKELVHLVNVDLDERGSLSKRHGFVQRIFGISGKSQGHFYYHKSDSDYVEEVMAINGKLYRVDHRELVEIKIDGLESFQSEREVEGVEYMGALYIATGSGLVEYSGGEKAKLIEPYVPNTLEFLYLGGNLLFDDPNSVLRQTDGQALKIDYIVPTPRKPVTGETVKFVVYYTASPENRNKEWFRFFWKYKGAPDSTLQVFRDWKTGAGANEVTTWFGLTGDLEIVVQAAYTVSPDVPPNDILEEARIPKFTVTAVKEDDESVKTTIKNCNKIIVHHERLLLYGDTVNKNLVYMSYIQNPAYFPSYTTIQFENLYNEPLLKLIQYRDVLLAFSENTIQCLTGSSAADFKRSMVNTSLGCIAPNTVTIVGNHVAFLSADGVYVLKSLNFSEARMNVEKIDAQIKSLIPRDSSACALYNDGQYHLCYPNLGIRFRYYTIFGTWTMDKSDALRFVKMFVHEEKVNGLNAELGSVLEEVPGIYTDVSQNYEMLIETKMFDFGAPYNTKKLKRLNIMFGTSEQKSEANLKVYADHRIIAGDEKEEVYVNDQHQVDIKVIPSQNMTFNAGTILGEWEMGSSAFGTVPTDIFKLRISGKCYRSKIVITSKDSSPFQVLGLSYIFKLGKVK